MFGSGIYGAAALLLLAVVSAVPASAQSLFAGSGLGYAAEPLDARARGLGGVGLGLAEPNLSLLNPASVAGLLAPTVHVTVQSDQFTSTYADTEASGGTVRFPIIHVALPFRERWTASIAYGSFLDRNWGVQRDTTFAIGTDTFQVRDRFASRGGVARLRLGGAYRLMDELALGASVDLYTGSARDTIYRIFPETLLRPAVTASAQRFGGFGFGAGARWSPTEALSVSASASAGGQLEVRPADDAEPTATFDLPVQLAAGASGRITPTTLLAVSARWAGWSSVGGGLTEPGNARDVVSLSGGVEWDALRFGDRVIPLRLGVRSGELPFRAMGAGADAGWAREQAVTAGAGLLLGGGAAILDAAVERGRRDGEAVDLVEDFWRFGFSLTVLGR
ncbi:hypothetical protein BH23GEM3_BH23GEM3_09020 [soil metagenome]